ncbi:type II toxin-antitoxin system toxin DNA ADP-ribosyl transferase DarT [Geobacillus sp. YF-1]|uniref:type II toxin-antitoxin system toxin DNA ADP-ribosyl transferase DarT n=1 Tax=Geobacillus sp. YF-1 TaxID=3457480 RepID=UPI004045D3B8
MGIEQMMQKSWLYHITHYRNLPSIFAQGGLVANHLAKSKKISYVDIAHASIQDRRLTTEVPLPPFGTLHDYVPFYFAPRSPMLYAINKGRVEGYKGGQDEIVYLLTRTDLIHLSGLSYVFTDGHPVMKVTDFYQDLYELSQIDWDIMRSTYWHDTEEDPDRKRRRQAEFLVYQFVPIHLLAAIAVKSREWELIVRKIAAQHRYQGSIIVRPEWYF